MHWLRSHNVPRRSRYNKRDLPNVFAFTDEDRLQNVESFLQALPIGIGVVLRTRNRDTAERLLQRAQRLRPDLFTLVSVNSGPQNLSADGFHIPQANWRMLPRVARSTTRRWVSASAHSLFACRRAIRLGADIVFLSPVFPTKSHPGAKSLGLQRFGRIGRAAQGKIVALGGIKLRHLPQILAVGGFGVAGIGLFNDKDKGL